MYILYNGVNSLAKGVGPTEELLQLYSSESPQKKYKNLPISFQQMSYYSFIHKELRNFAQIGNFSLQIQVKFVKYRILLHYTLVFM